MAKLNFLLLLASFASAIYVVDMRTNIGKQTHLYGVELARVQDIKMRKDELMFWYANEVDFSRIKAAADKQNMRLPRASEVVELP